MKGIFTLFLLFFPLFLISQELTYETSAEETVKEGIILGKFIFSPSLEFIYENKDNVFLTSSNEIDDQIYLMRPKLVLELPKEDSYLKFSWVPQYRDFQDIELKENWTHFFNVEGRIKTPGGLELTAGDKYIMKGTLEVNEIDAGEELVFGLLPFDKNNLYFDMKYFMDSTNGFGLNADYSDISFDDPEMGFEKVWYDYKSTTYGATYQRYMNPLLRMAAGVNFIKYDPENIAPFRKYDGMDYYVKFYGDFTPTVNASVKLGYEDLDFDGAKDYKDWNVNAQIVWNFTKNRNFVVSVLRQGFPSNYGFAGSYTHNSINFAYNFNITEKFFSSFSAGLGKNDYNNVARVDDWWEGRANFGYHFNPLMSLRFNYIYQNRDSNQECFQGCDYKANTYLINFVIGY